MCSVVVLSAVAFLKHGLVSKVMCMMSIVVLNFVRDCNNSTVQLTGNLMLARFSRALGEYTQVVSTATARRHAYACESESMCARTIIMLPCVLYSGAH